MTNSETSFNRTPIDLSTVRDAALRELRGRGAASTDDLPEAILQRLAANEPVTSPLLFFAVRAGDAPLSACAQRRIVLPLAAQIEAVFQAEVEEFCRKFFELEPENRRARWSELRRKTSGSPALTARLEELSQGLDVESWRMSDERPAVQRVAALVREFFVLPPLERAIKRREWLATQAAEAKRLRRAAGRLAESFPKIASLDPLTIQSLSTPAGRPSWRNRVRINAATSNETPREKSMRLASKIATWGFSAMVGLCILVGVVAVLNSPRYVPRSQPAPLLPPEDGFSWPDKPDPPTSPLNAGPAKDPLHLSTPSVAKKLGGGR
jgi:hypothetical protein